ncbi:glycosyltransferase family 4 protein [Tenacibaculum soleae]|uniref:glycosyltransferase family 4 protein n=1 Tax=Tenacibaculum soleae TaxID=447689 RepID=UPI0026E2F705|nr:glycosyltransferase family 4 protein [Tenacibaculum soleae]MDO6812884.1 glycosyltransferase family 4 protein [Tenacibaculum soleae]
MKSKHVLFLNYHSLPKILDPNEKLIKFHFVYDVLLELKKKHKISVIEFIGVKNFFIKNNIFYYFQRKTNNKKFLIDLKTHFLIKKISPDVIYIHGFSKIYHVIFFKFYLKKNTKIIIQHHAERPPHNWLKKNILSKLDKFVDAYIFTSIDMADNWISKDLISSRVKIFTQPELSTHFSYNSTIKKDANLFIWVGRLNKNKDPITIIEAFISYIKINSKAKLVLFYSEKELEKKIIDILNLSGITNEIKLMGVIDNSELEEWYQKSTYFLLGSYYEGGSTALIESMACGCIPIITNIASNRAITENGKYAKLFKPGDKEDLLEKLKSLKNFNSKSLSLKIKNHFNNKLSFKALSSGLEKLIETLFNHH